MPASMQSRPLVTADSPLRASLAPTTSITRWRGRPISCATSPIEIMFSRPPSTDLASSPIGHSMIVHSASSTAFGGLPAVGSQITRPPFATGIALMKRSAFFQSMATRMSKSLDIVAAGSVESRTSAAASPPRICGPTDRFISPYQPALPAASSRILPDVTAPAPPVPTIAKETFFA